MTAALRCSATAVTHPCRPCLRPVRWLAPITRIIVIAIVIATATPALAAGDEASALLKVQPQETDVATKTPMNSDFAPGNVTILEGDRLRALGVRNVWEAMAFVPGVQAVLDVTGTPSIVVRGIPFSFNSGNIRILLDSNPITSEAAGLSGSVLYMPTSQIERIEVICGPDTVVHGEYAFQGLVNIVTRKGGNEIAGTATSHGAGAASLLLSGNPGGIDTSVNLAGSTSNDAILPVGLGGRERRLSGVVSLAYDSLSLRAQVFERHLRDIAGTPILPTPRQDETNWSTKARYGILSGPNGDVGAHVQYQRNDIADPGAAYAGHEVSAGVEAHWNGWNRQHWLTGVEYADTVVDRASFLPKLPTFSPPVPDLTNRHRRVASVYAQDQIELSPSLTATVGVRYDNNSDIGSRATPRAALTWHAGDRHIVKAQYSEGERSPTFFELYGPRLGGVSNSPSNLDFEVNQTGEVSYIYRQPRLVLRATAFDTRINNLIFVAGLPQQFGNVARADAQGVDFELTQEIGSTLRVDANVSLVHSRDNRNLPQRIRTSIPAVPRWMGNLGLLWSPREHLVCSLRWNHAGNTQSGSGSNYDVADLSVRRTHLWGGAVDWEAGVSNLFKQRVTYLIPAPNAAVPQLFDDRVAWTRFVWHW